MGMNHWEWEGMSLKKTFPFISNKKSFWRRTFAGSYTDTDNFEKRDDIFSL